MQQLQEEYDSALDSKGEVGRMEQIDESVVDGTTLQKTSQDE